MTFCSPISSLSAGGIRLNIDVPIVDKPISTRAIPVIIGNKGVIGAGFHSVVFPVSLYGIAVNLQ